MNEFHRNFVLQLRHDAANDGRWLTFGMPPQRAYCNNPRLGDERQVESVYAAEVLRRYLWARPRALVLHGLDCGASKSPEAVRIQNAWRGCHIEWSAADINEVTADIYTETWQGCIGDMPAEEWGDFDFVLAVSTVEHSDFVDDSTEAALGALHRALSLDGVLVLTLPIGVGMQGPDFEQYPPEVAQLMLSRFKVVHERFWRWNGEHFENCLAEDTKGCIYGHTNGAACAAAVGAWVLAR